MVIIKSTVILLALLFLSSSFSDAASRVIEIYPSNADTTCNEEFENVVNTLMPGDVLVLHGGIYSQSCRRLITGRNGTPDAPIIIEAALGEAPILTRPDNATHSYPENNIEIENSSYLIIRGLGFRGGDIGVRFMGSINHITFEDNEVYETGANALALNSGNSDSMVLRRNHIHHTGLDTSSSTTGEGMYLGCNYNTCRLTNSLIEGNYIHHLRATNDGGNDGIEVKVGSYGNVIRDNVIHDTTIGTRYPCIFVYGGGVDLNRVEGNAMWNCGEAIYAVADAIVQNNIIFSSDVGIASYSHVQVSQMRNLTVVNNTIYGNGECLYARWSSVTNAVLANNAIYCPSTTAVDASGFSNVQVAITNNYVEGDVAGASIDNQHFFAGGTATAAFIDPGTANFWPQATSILLGKADPAYSPAADFNNTSRIAPIDVGAYETNGSLTNPGWQIQQGFKGTVSSDSIAPTVSITSPANGTIVKRKGIVSIAASAEDNVGVIRVEFYINGALQCTDSEAPYACSWKVPNNGSTKNYYYLEAKAYDAASNVGTATVTVKTR
jgi:hypothetical protein